MRLFLFCSFLGILSGCGNAPTVQTGSSPNVVLDDSLQQDTTLFKNNAQREQELRHQVFPLALEPPTFKDTALWCQKLKSKYGTICGCEKLNFADIGKHAIWGSNDSLLLVHLDFKMDSLPHAQQFVFNPQGNLIFQADASVWRLVSIFPNQKPALLLATASLEMPNHHIYKVENEQFIDMMDEFSENIPRTMGSDNAQFYTEPNELKLTLEDVDKDSLNDLVFTGKKMYLDKKIKPENLRYTFIYKKAKEMFIYKK